MKYAEVSVNSPIAQRRTFSYAIPSGLSITVGQAVWVPFGEKILQGIVLELNPYPAVEETRDIIGVVEPRPILSPAHVMLARWISEYYLSPLFDAVALMLPPGFEQKPLTFIAATPGVDNRTLSSLSSEQKQALESIRERGNVSLKELEKRLGKRKAQTIISQLVRQGLVSRRYELEPVKVSPKIVPYLYLNIDSNQAGQTAKQLREKMATKQANLLDFLAQQTEAVPLTEVRKQTGCDKSIVDALVSKGLVTMQQTEVKREPISYKHITPSTPLKLTATQETVFKTIRDAINGTKPHNSVFLLHGVTGSGKTEVYLQALAEAVKLGKRGIVLVPEIALTPQTIERFAARFPHKVAVLHSQLSPGEQFDEWHSIRNGD
ncbi:DEAD/DEAH box helicase family protein, partial [Chloroflexota bacterium]